MLGPDSAGAELLCSELRFVDIVCFRQNIPAAVENHWGRRGRWALFRSSFLLGHFCIRSNGLDDFGIRVVLGLVNVADNGDDADDGDDDGGREQFSA